MEWHGLNHVAVMALTGPKTGTAATLTNCHLDMHGFPPPWVSLLPIMKTADKLSAVFIAVHAVPSHPHRVAQVGMSSSDECLSLALVTFLTAIHRTSLILRRMGMFFRSTAVTLSHPE
jgi:hypothetical protein